MKILFVPLDERPCNYQYPQMVAESKKEIQLVIPPINLLGNKKQSAKMNELWDFVNDRVQDVDTAVLSMDMLLFGGLIHSRVHTLDKNVVDIYLDNIKKLKEINPNFKLYAFECIMRSPNYNSSEEEPDYYESYGRSLNRRAYLEDKKKRDVLSEMETKEMDTISIPNDIIEDYESRRNFNLSYNLKVVELVKNEIIDFLVIPQDDSSEYGYTAIAQKEIIQYLSKHNLESKISIYPGADEVGISLLARCLNDHMEQKAAVYAFYSSTLGQSIIPNYEDRPFHENLKYHLDVTNSYLVNKPEDADFILAINTPGKKMEEAFYQENKDITYSSFRNLLYFVKEIERFLEKGYKLSICDSAFSNGGDLQLIKFMDERCLLDKLLAYAGWNTNSNTLGTVLGMSIFSYNEVHKNKHHLVYRLLEDVFYQSQVRQDVIKDVLPKLGLSYYNFLDKEIEVTEAIQTRILEVYKELNLSKTLSISSLKIEVPWKRMFEIGMDLTIQDQETHEFIL